VGFDSQGAHQAQTAFGIGEDAYDSLGAVAAGVFGDAVMAAVLTRTTLHSPGYRRRMQMKTARSDPIVVPFVPVAAFLLVGFALHSGTLRCRLWGWQPSHLVLTPNSDCYVKAAHDWCDRLGGYGLRFSLVGRLTVVDA
jgi:hypothetical protein